MACKSDGSWKMDADQELILHALTSLGGPASGKEIGGAVGLDAKVVSSKIKQLRNKGFVDTPVRCKFAITDLGRKHVK